MTKAHDHMHTTRLDRIESALYAVLALQGYIISKVDQMNATADTIDTELATLQADVESLKTVTQSAIALINGIAAQIAAAVAAASASGATPTQLAAMASLGSQLEAQSAALAAAVTANTPAAVPPAP